MTVVPDRYKESRNNLGFDEVNIGYNGFELFTVDAIVPGQVGYSVSPNRHLGPVVIGENREAFRRFPARER
jgi:hypothetical protein